MILSIIIYNQAATCLCSKGNRSWVCFSNETVVQLTKNGSAVHCSCGSHTTIGRDTTLQFKIDASVFWWTIDLIWSFYSVRPDQGTFQLPILRPMCLGSYLSNLKNLHWIALPAATCECLLQAWSHIKHISTLIMRGEVLVMRITAVSSRSFSKVSKLVDTSPTHKLAWAPLFVLCPSSHTLAQLVKNQLTLIFLLCPG